MIIDFSLLPKVCLDDFDSCFKFRVSCCRCRVTRGNDVGIMNQNNSYMGITQSNSVISVDRGGESPPK